MDKNVDSVVAYHCATKHHFNRYARSRGFLDWATQPDPFRRYDGAPLFLLPFTEADTSPLYEDLYVPGRVPPRPLTLPALAEFFECSLAISAWKESQGARWALRCNPSSGNLHPTEGYLAAPALPGLHDAPAVYHYAPREHGLERRTEFPVETWRALAADFPEGTFFAGLSSIHWREAWKYGERAYRYCQHDVGHALAAYAISAAALGWTLTHLDALSDADAARLLGLDREADRGGAEPEHPDLVVAVCPNTSSAPIPRALPEAVVARVAANVWHGQANALSADHVEWEAIDTVAAACEKPRTASTPREAAQPYETSLVEGVGCGLTAKHIIQQRRSAVAMDGETAIEKSAFYRMLARVMPWPDAMPWETLGPPAAIHLGLFVHRVRGIAPGLYALVRNPNQLSALHAAMKPSFRWEKPPGCPGTLPLYLLQAGDCREAATKVSCLQDIAGEGAFSLGMIAEFEPRLHEHGAWFYRRLFWETGMIGQVLYLEAEAASLRATGIGCFFDDPVHHLFGLEGPRYQSLYHFTVGGPIEDRRITTRPAYTAQRRTP